MPETQTLKPWPPIEPVLVDSATGLITTEGLPVYRFVPYGVAVASGVKSPVVPWADQWPSYVKPGITHYAPLPKATSEVPGIAKDLHFQERPGAADDVEQAVYRGWPLYVFDLDAPHSGPQGRVPGQFELVMSDIPALPDGEGLPTWPNLYGGP